MFQKTARWLGLYEILTNSPLIHFIDTSLCKKTAITIRICDNLLFALTGFDSVEFDEVSLLCSSSHYRLQVLMKIAENAY